MKRPRPRPRPVAGRAGGDADAFVSSPARMPLLFRGALRVARRRTGADLQPIAALTWSPRAAIGATALEALAARPVGRVDERLLKLVRLTVSFTLTCPFCVGLNAAGWESLLTADELATTQGLRKASDVASLAARERLAIGFARGVTQTPPALTAADGRALRESFSEEEIVVLAATCAQVNYWARLVQGLGYDPAG
ncbi:MAG: carboxymuconolactone decarboxylase family protein [Acidobacteria bacterium]|nr:carboxymuconolactone decarboxylase family protein [Acidobacteriota bacterium]